MRARLIKKISGHSVLLLGAAISIFPFYWMIVMATSNTGEIFHFPPTLTFQSHFLQNVRAVLDDIDFFGAMLLTVIVAAATTMLVLFLDSLAGFTFAKYHFPGRTGLFAFLLVTFMIPAQLALVPLFIIMAHIGWAGSLQALIVPGAANAFGIFWMRQYAQEAIPDDLIAAAKVDGAGFMRQYWNVGLPVLRPALAFLGIFTFIAVWNDYLWPLVVLVDPNHVTLQVALTQLNTSLYTTNYSVVITGALLSTIPLIVIFLIGARHIVTNLTVGALKF